MARVCPWPVSGDLHHHLFPMPRFVVCPLPCSPSALGYELLQALPRNPSPSYLLVIGARSPHVTTVDILSSIPYECFDDGPQWAARPRQSAQGCLPLWALVAAFCFPPLILWTQRMKRSGGGDVHQSSLQPPFSCRGSMRAPPRYPGHALE